MSTLSSMFLLVRIVHVTYVPTVHQLNMSIESALLSVEDGRVLGGRVAYLLTQRTVYQWLWRGRWRERAVTRQQASKKWENLKKKYKDLRTPKTRVGD
ncbi:unnamed protein product [Arctogadus glacialis]